MKKLVVPIALLFAAGTQPASAGPVDSPIPPNPCSPSQGTFRLVQVINGVGADATNADTIVTCVSGEPAGTDQIDVMLEWFNPATGASLGVSAAACGRTPGATATFVTNDIGSGNNSIFHINGSSSVDGRPGANSTPVAVPPFSSLRVLSSSPKVICEVTIYEPVSGGPHWAQDGINTARTAGQKGD